MLFELTEEQKLIQTTAREFAVEKLAKYATQIDRSEAIPDEIIKYLAKMGFWGIVVPEEFGGAGLDTFSLVLAIEEISRACAATAVTLSVHNSLVCNALVKYGTSAQKQKYLPRLSQGQIIGAYALTEANAGSDAASLATTAHKKENHYILNGAKLFITNAPIAGLFVIFARTHPDKTLRGDGISAFLVEPGTAGFRLGLKEQKMGIRGAGMCEIIMENCAIPLDARLGEENKGFNLALDILNSGRIGIAAQSVGIAQACLDASLKYARQRKQFGQTLSEFQAIQWKLARMATDISAARLLTYQAAALKDKNLSCIKEASMAKLFASMVSNRCATEAVQIHGGAGYTKDFPVERFFRDAKVTEIYEGTSEVQNIVISRELFK